MRNWQEGDTIVVTDKWGMESPMYQVQEIQDNGEVIVVIINQDNYSNSMEMNVDREYLDDLLEETRKVNGSGNVRVVKWDVGNWS